MKYLKKDVGLASLIILNGVFLLLCPILKITDFNVLLIGTFLLISGVYLVRFLINMKNNFYLMALNGLVSLGMIFALILTEASSNPKMLAICLMFWIMFMALIKLKNADIFHDKKNKLWLIDIIFMILFIIIGILTCINFLYSNETSILIFGYFIFIVGTFDLITIIINYLTKGRVK